MSLKIIYNKEENREPLGLIKDGILIIGLPSQHYIDLEQKKLEIAKQSFNDIMIDKQVKAFNEFKNRI
jgi:hypothetical protein